MRSEERRYYDRRADEYDEWWEGSGRFRELERPGWAEEVQALTAVVAGLPPGRVLDVGCGTGFLTRHLRGDVTALDQSERMLAHTAARCPRATFVQADALALPFEEGRFERVFTSHFYGHLRAGERVRFLAEARRVAQGLVVVDSALRPGVREEEVQERVLNDGSLHRVYKRYFSPERLVAELGGRTVLMSGDWFVAVAA
ncbi:MAG: class I SAM-dependent methyltransferase [Actinomycetota bacterium]|nr:class I SAM-dependent methyltransferase [Actinomycetota bacterium]